MPRLNSSTKIRKIKRERERELSKTIATILTVIVIFASIIFITIVFFREDEERTKTSLKLEDIKISNNNLKITVENTGKIPIDKIILKIEGDKGKADFEYDGIDILNTKEIKIDLSTKDIGRPDRIEVTPNIAEKETTGRIFYSPRPSTLYEFSTEEQKAAVSAPNNIVTWHFDTHKANVSLINEIAETKFITHVIISNKDFNEEPTPNMSALDKLNATKEKGLIPIWERDLWFRRGNRSKELFAQPFIKNYTDGSIIYDKDYYIWFLNKLREEADFLGVELVSIDVEPYENPNGLRDLINNFNQNNFTQLNMTTNEVIQTPGVLRAHYIYPVSVNSNRYHAYWALGKLGQNKITETTYKDCPCPGCILNGSLIEDFQLTGVWATADNNCYREAISCDLSLYNKTCSMGSTALWSAQSIFENHAFWFDVDRGLFIYTNNQSGEDFYFPQKISDYCEANQDLCRQYGWQAIICTDNDLDSYNQSASGCGVADCNDANLSINPGATEICDGLDNNCVNGIDEGVFTIYYKDNDSDSFGNITSSQQACTQPLGYVASNTDCNDNNALEKPGQIWYRDIDDDGHSDGSTLTQCPRPISYKVASELIATGGDCDDLNSTINPEAMDNTCDGINNDCDAQTDEGYTPTATSCGLGQCTNNTGQLICSSGTLTDTCDSFGGATMESCEDNSGYDNIDNNCDGVVDLDCSAYCDQDQDNYSPNLICLLGGYFVGDCDDTNAGINPGTSELCDNVDNDCSSGSVDGSDEAWYGQATNCGLGQCTNTGQLTCQSGSQVNTCTPGAPSEEICDGLDNNCDVTIDNGNNLLCDNGQFCDGNEICGGTSGCQVGTVPCNPATHTCIEATDSCQLLPGTCTTNADCSDGIFCNGAESCVGGSCIAGTQVVCNDNITCTIDSCNEVDGCLFTENHAGCQDGQYCNGVESCSIANLGCISGTPVTCAPDLFSCTDDKCNEAIDSCQNIENSTNCPLYSQGQICSITNFPDPTGTGCGFVQNCVDADNDGLLDYNINKCPLGKDYCDYTNKTYFENNPSQLNNYLPEKGDYNVSEVNSSNVLNHSEFRIILGNIGEIMFKMDLNLIRINETGCFEKLDFNLSELIKIENNKIFLNSSMHSEFSKPAKLIFQNINFAQPKILRDGAECSSSACLIINYSNNILEVDVPGFSFYEVVEGFISPPPGDGSGGGGGGTTPRACIVEWTCTSWSDCINGTQIRSCSDNNNCTAQSNKPTERQECRLTTGIVTNETAIAPGNIVRETIKWFTEKALIILIVVLTVVLIAIIIVLTATRSRKTEEKKIF